MTGVSDSQQLKVLESRMSILASQKRELSYQATELNKQVADVDNKIRMVQQDLQRLRDSNKPPIVSEHAILRYLERVEGVDMDAVKTKILTTQVLSAIKALGSGKFPSGSGFRVLVRNNTIQTVETE